MPLSISPKTQTLMLPTPTGMLECAWDTPAGLADEDLRGVTVIAHPHPLHGGSMDNKVVHTIARAFLQLNYQVWWFNFRGVGASEGQWDEGRGEVDDMMAVVNHVQGLPGATNKPLVLAGFSFGSYIAAQVAQRIAQAGQAAQRLVLVGVAADRYAVALVPEGTLVIHGEQDEVVPLGAVMDWARPQSLPVVVIPGVGHFFHGHLPLLRNIIIGNWQVE